jgi:uncharacterized protein YukE
MLNKVATRIQSRLSRKGLKVVLGEIKEQCIKTFQNIENPTKVEINAVTDYFMNNATTLTVITEDIEAVTTNEAATELETLTNNNSEELEPETTLETSISVDVENGNIQPTITEDKETLGTVDSANEVNTLTTGNNSHPVTADQDTENIPQSQHQVDRTGWYQPAPLANTTKSELVTSTAQGLGVVLNEAEIELIATNVNCSSDDLQETLEEIKGAIIAFIQHRIANNSQKIDETLQEIVQVATDGFNQNSQQLTDGLRNINQQLQQQSKDFKSKVKSTIKCFQHPEAS